MVDARSFLLTLHNRPKVIRKLLVQGSPCARNFVAPMQPLDCLLCPKSDEHAEYDNSDFANKRAPAVQRFGNVEVHAVGPSGYVTVTEGRNGRNASKADIRNCCPTDARLWSKLADGAGPIRFRNSQSHIQRVDRARVRVWHCQLWQLSAAAEKGCKTVQLVHFPRGRILFSSVPPGRDGSLTMTLLRLAEARGS